MNFGYRRLLVFTQDVHDKTLALTLGSYFASHSLWPLSKDQQSSAIAESGPYDDMEQLVRRVDLNLTHLEALATAGAFDCFGLSRREALWSAGAVAQSRPGRLQGIVTGSDAPTLPGMSLQEEAVGHHHHQAPAAVHHPEAAAARRSPWWRA